VSKLELRVRVTFRAFGLTLGVYERQVERVIPVSLAGSEYTLMRINERGVEVVLTWVPVNVRGTARE